MIRKELKYVVKIRYFWHPVNTIVIIIILGEGEPAWFINYEYEDEYEYHFFKSVMFPEYKIKTAH